MIPTRPAINAFRCAWHAKGKTFALAFLLAAITALTFQIGTAHAVPATLSVTNTNDSGPGSLRQAITDANSNANPEDQDTIEFEIPAATDAGCDAGSGVCTIAPSTILPTISQSVVVDGYSQEGATPNTLDVGNDAALKIQLSGANLAVGAEEEAIGITAPNSVVRGLVINRFTGAGVRIVDSAASGNVVEGNYIGTDVSGTAGLGNSGFGVSMVNAPNNVVGGDTPAARNIISGNGTGILVNNPAASGNTIAGNYIGTDASGTQDLGNSEGGFGGVYISGSPDNVVGGTTAGARNVVSGNDDYGITVTGVGTSGNRIEGNYIGTDASGTQDLGNSQSGVFVAGAPNNVVGGTTPGARNVVSGNEAHGVYFTDPGTSGSRVEGNYIGTDASGTQDLGNTGNGVIVADVPDTVVGGTAAGARNIISGNNNSGVLVLGPEASGNRIEGNYLGTDVNGTADLGNNSDGVSIENASNNVVGGTVAGARNVASGNGVGVRVGGAQASSNTIAGNYLGTDASGTQDLGNSAYGVVISEAQNNVVGGTTGAARNIITGNGSDGILVFFPEATGNRILRNSIFSNDSLGIDLNDGDQTPNDPQDPDTGPNNLQNFPVLASANSTTVTGSLNSTPNSTFTVQFFSNPSGGDEGQTFIGQQNVSTDGTGNTGTFTFSPANSIPAGRTVTATATNTVTGDTSEFSAPRVVLEAVPPRVTSVTPAEDANEVAVATNVTARFSEAVREQSITSTTFTLRRAGQTQQISATRTYDAATRRATLNPTANLARGATYVATVTPGVRDIAGNQLDQDSATAGNQSKTWRFTIR